MAQTDWADLGLTEDVIARLYTVGRRYAANRISVEHREDAIQEAMCLVLAAVSQPAYPKDPEGRFKYLCKTLCNAIPKLKHPQDTNIPVD